MMLPDCQKPFHTSVDTVHHHGRDIINREDMEVTILGDVFMAWRDVTATMRIALI